MTSHAAAEGTELPFLDGVLRMAKALVDMKLRLPTTHAGRPQKPQPSILYQVLFSLGS